MKRDLEIVRQILLEIEETGLCQTSVVDLKYLQGLEPTPEEIRDQAAKQYHYLLLVDAGFIRTLENKWWIEGLSWEAHDFLDAVREKTRWDKVKQYFKDQGKDVSSVPLQMVESAAIRLLADASSFGV